MDVLIECPECEGTGAVHGDSGVDCEECAGACYQRIAGATLVSIACPDCDGYGLDVRGARCRRCAGDGQQRVRAREIAS